MANNFKVVFFEKVQRDNGTTTQWYYSALNLIWEDLPLRHQVFNQNSGHGIALIRFLSCPIERLLNS